MTTRVPCSRCGALVLPSTAEKYSGLCAPCSRGTRDHMETARRLNVEARTRHDARQARIASARLYSGPDELTHAVDSITDPENDSHLETLEVALRSLSTLPDPALVAPALFRLFERFPWVDGFGLFWSVLHSLERLRGYETLLIESVRRSPGEFNLLMVNRLINGGTVSLGSTNLLTLLVEVAARPGYSDRARDEALRFLEFQSVGAP